VLSSSCALFSATTSCFPLAAVLTFGRLHVRPFHPFPVVRRAATTWHKPAIQIDFPGVPQSKVEEAMCVVVRGER
jgi:hypothetical protein